jgi:hypothetical protein
MRSHLDKKKSSFLFSLSLVFSFFWSCIDLVLLRRLLEIGRLVRRSSSTTRTKLNLLIWQNDRCWSTMWNKASGLRPCHLVLFCVSVCSGSSLKTCKLAWCFMKPHKRCSWSIVINIFFSVTMLTFSTKAELLQLNRTQFPSLGIFVSRKFGNRKN